MTLDYYRIFYYVAQYQSFSKAAEILGNNQPNLSRCMNLLESELGCKLLVRTNRGVSLTPEGPLLPCRYRQRTADARGTGNLKRQKSRKRSCDHRGK